MCMGYIAENSFRYEGETRHGRPYGAGRIFRPDGTLLMEGQFGIKGLLAGKVYREDGALRYEGSFRVNRNYGPNIPNVGMLYAADGTIICRGNMPISCGGVGFPCPREPSDFKSSEYKMPVTPFMREDERACGES